MASQTSQLLSFTEHCISNYNDCPSHRIYHIISKFEPTGRHSCRPPMACFLQHSLPSHDQNHIQKCSRVRPPQGKPPQPTLPAQLQTATARRNQSSRRPAPLCKPNRYSKRARIRPSHLSLTRGRGRIHEQPLTFTIKGPYDILILKALSLASSSRLRIS